MNFDSRADSSTKTDFSERPDELAFHFFKEFARFEYALKAAGFNNGEGEAKPNWSNFSKSMRPEFDNPNLKEMEIYTSVKYILDLFPNSIMQARSSIALRRRRAHRLQSRLCDCGKGRRGYRNV